ncbi:hypothetical protein SV7mr_22200 [Stieleria bergensis]|uniref:Uncharacterized protein n=1 Tax=Stieleria bergensis TaxID=2528025 RepID=A0A517SUB8_9BACT|nr:hypothetical protein SV7mr_22200 [Planctomycetes bacterium SV_7m_r]
MALLDRAASQGSRTSVDSLFDHGHPRAACQTHAALAGIGPHDRTFNCFSFLPEPCAVAPFDSLKQCQDCLGGLVGRGQYGCPCFNQDL